LPGLSIDNPNRSRDRFFNPLKNDHNRHCRLHIMNNGIAEISHPHRQALGRVPGFEAGPAIKIDQRSCFRRFAKSLAEGGDGLRG
jgi:hypothetical protein